MSWEFEQRFFVNGSMNDPGAPTGPEGDKTFGTPLQYTTVNAMYSGHDLWVFLSNSRWIERRVYNVWDERGDYEHLSYHYYFDNNGGTIVRADTSELIQVDGKYTGEKRGGAYMSGGKSSVTKWYNRFYTLFGTNILAWDTETYEYIGVVTTMPSIVTSTTVSCTGSTDNFTQLTAGSNICASNGKLFITSYEATASDNQRICVYDLNANTWDTQVLPGRSQTADRHLIDGLDGSVWVTNKNNHGIIRVSNTTNQPIATIRVNRHPYRLSVNQSKELFVASDAGNNTVTRKDYPADMSSSLTQTVGGGFITGGQAYTVKVTEDVSDGQISIINQGDNSQAEYAAARCNGDVKDKDFYDDGVGYMWFATDKHIGRLKKSDKELKMSFTETKPESVTEEPDYDMIPDNGTIVFDGPSIGSVYAVGTEQKTLKVTIPGNLSQLMSYTNTLTIRKCPIANVDGVYKILSVSYDNIATTIVTVEYTGDPIDYTTTTGTAYGAGCQAAVVSPQFHYEKWNGTTFDAVTVKPYLYTVYTDGNKFYVTAVRLSALVRKPKYIHLGTAMIATGDQAYYGG